MGENINIFSVWLLKKKIFLKNATSTTGHTGLTAVVVLVLSPFCFYLSKNNNQRQPKFIKTRSPWWSDFHKCVKTCVNYVKQIYARQISLARREGPSFHDAFGLCARLIANSPIWNPFIWKRFINRLKLRSLKARFLKYKMLHATKWNQILFSPFMHG